MERRTLVKGKLTKEDKIEMASNHVKKKDKYMVRNSGRQDLAQPTENPYANAEYEEIFDQVRNSWNCHTYKPKPKVEEKKKPEEKQKENNNKLEPPKLNLSEKVVRSKEEIQTIVDRL